MPLSPVLFSSASDDWGTPQDLYDRLHAEFGFQLDPCAMAHNTKCDLWFGPDHPDPSRRDGLAHDWSVGPIWLNSPYGRSIGLWTRKAAAAAAAGHTVVCLIPARTDTRWFHDDLLANGAEIRFVRGRLTFGAATTPAPFPSIIAILRPVPTDVARTAPPSAS